MPKEKPLTVMGIDSYLIGDLRSLYMIARNATKECVKLIPGGLSPASYNFLCAITFCI